MIPKQRKLTSLGVIALLAILMAAPSTAEARRYRKRVRHHVRPVVVAPFRYATPRYVRRGYVGVNVGRGVAVRAPGVGVFVGW